MEINEFLREIEKSGFIYESDYITGKTKYFKDDNELEFLTTLSRDGSQIQKFGYIAAESLPKLDILVNNTVEVSLDDCKVTIPSPEAYVLHKILINRDRAETKKEKDLNSVKTLLEYIHDDISYSKKLCRLYDSLGKKEKKRVDEMIDSNNLSMFKQILYENNNRTSL